MAKIDPMYNLINTILNDKEIVIFLGGGASMEGKQGAQPFPGFEKLIDTILRDWGFNPDEKKKRFENFLTVIKKWEDEKALSVRLSKYLEGEPGLAHYYLTALSIALFNESNALLYLTTNYDDLVMNAFSDLKRNPVKPFKIVPISLRPNIAGSEFREITHNVEGHLKEGRPVIIKLFGDLNSQCPIFRKDDMKFEPEVEGKLIEWLRKPMIVIGYSFSDKIMEELLISSRGVSPVFLVNPSKKIPNSIKTMDRVHHIESVFFDFISSLLKIIKDKNPSINEKVDKIIESIGLPPIVSKPTGEPDKPPASFNSKTKKKILILASNPKDTGRVRFDEEIREIEDAILRAKKRSKFEVKTKIAVRLRDIRQALLDHEPQIVHFIGHGKNEGLMVETEVGNQTLFSTEALSGLFECFSTQVECVILNACFSEPQAAAIKEHICCVIGMRREIIDKSAIEFTVGFYDALGAGKTYKDAFKLGRNAIHMFNLPEHDVPTLEEKSIKNKNSSEGNISPNDSPIQVAIRSYMSYSEDIDDKVDQICCLCHLFEGRHLLQGTWEDLKQQIKTFIGKTIKAGNRYDLYLPLHSSLAFFVGRELPVKSGVEVNIYQPSPRLELWRLPQRCDLKNNIIWNVDETEILNTGNEMAIACSVSHNIFPDVKAYIKNQLPHISHLMHLSLNDIHHGSIKDANHGYEASYKAVAHIKEKYRQKVSSRLHLFLAAPNVFTFMLGQQSLQLSNITLYEHELGANILGAYTPSITI